MTPEEIVRKHRRDIELSPGLGTQLQDYGIAVCNDILEDLRRAGGGEADATDAARYRWLCKQNNFLLHIENDAGEQKRVRLRCGAPLDSWLDDRIKEEKASEGEYVEERKDG